MTCNPNWPEIQNNLLPGQTTQDRQPPEDSLYQENEIAVGRKILASSFQCSPRWYNQKFQDAMAIVR